MKLQRKIVVQQVPAAEIDQLDAQARARESEKLAANPKAPMPAFINGRAPEVRVKWPKAR